MKINTYDPRKEKEVFAGDFDTSTGVFTKIVTKRHYMLLEGGYGIQAEVMDGLSQVDCVMINIKTKDYIYSLPFKIWYEQGNYKNYGHGEQCFYPIKFMDKENKKMKVKKGV